MYYLHCLEKGKCSNNSNCHGNTLLTEIFIILMLCLFPKKWTPLHLEPGTPLDSYSD